MIKKLRIYLFALILLFVGACYNYTQSSAPKNKNLAYIYNPHSKTVHIDYAVFHTDDENSKIIARIHKNELFYVRSTVSRGRFANIKIKYRIYNSFTSKQIVDSATVIYNYREDVLKDIFDIEIPIKIKKDSSYSAKIVFTDLNRERKETDYLFIDKKSRFSSQNFIIENRDSNILVLDKIIKSNVNYTISNQRVKQKQFFISYYSQTAPPALLPFSTNKRNIEYKTDSTFLIKNTLNISNNGIYLIKADTSINKGLCLLNFTENFPDLKTPKELFEPLRYITSSSEYKKMRNSNSKKLVIDKFWLNLTGNPNRARELIRIYYTRVKLANIYFTSYKEGWKTDRGMIFTVFGAPTIVYKSDKYEKWIYGNNQTNAGLVFLFEKKIKYFSNNEFILHRNEVYKSTWYQAVDVWRSGRAFSVSY